jgi:hypothetical protein
MEVRLCGTTVHARLGPGFAATFDGPIAEPSDGVATLLGLRGDQAQPYGVLEQIADCSLELAVVDEVTTGFRKERRLTRSRGGTRS